MNRTLTGEFDAAPMAVEDMRPAIFPGVAEMHSLIATVLAMRSAPALRARMHELMHIADDRPFLLSRFQGTVWIEVGAGNSLRVLRKQVAGLPFVDIDQVLRAEPTLKDAIQASIGETGANSTAMRLLDPILDTRMFPARADMEELRRWAPLLEYAAYQSGAYAMVWLDAGRPMIVNGQASDAKRMLFPYWSGMHIMARLVFLASEPDASSWLGEMARSSIGNPGRHPFRSCENGPCGWQQARRDQRLPSERRSSTAISAYWRRLYTPRKCLMHCSASPP